MRRWLAPACVCLTLLLAACGEPPNKEMDQAQGAIDAARAAGAERYAPEEYKASVDALTRARQAVDERDYRLALNDALESFEHAQNAAREAADSKARQRGEVERLIAEVSTSLDQARQAVRDAERARPPRPAAVRTHQEALDIVDGHLQEARASVAAGDYAAANTVLADSKARIDTTVEAIERLTTSQSSRRRR
jgi:hypothetical protein